jgi:hypothetical protein
VVETEEAEPEDEGAREEPDDEESEGELVEVKPKLPAKTEAKGPPGGTCGQIVNKRPRVTPRLPGGSTA